MASVSATDGFIQMKIGGRVNVRARKGISLLIFSKMNDIIRIEKLLEN